MVSTEHLQLLSSEIVRLRAREPGWPRNLLVTMPPRHGKSELCSHWTPTWDLALEPADKIILTSYEAEFAAQWGRKVRRSVQEHYPIIGARLVEDSKAAHRWETLEGGGMVTAGVGGPITGKGGNILICDDPIKNAEEANSQLIRDNLWEWWRTTFITRADKDRYGQPAIVILIMTRWHEDDLAGRIMAQPEFKYWRHVNLPAVAEDDDPIGRAPGMALWPERFDELALETKRAEMGSRAFNALYQQRPSPPEGAAIHRAWWKWYDEPPPIQSFEQIIQVWDTTFKAADSSDFVAGMVLGRINAHDFYVLDVDHRRMNGPQTLKAITDMDRQWPQAKWCYIEDSASGSMILDILERERGHVVRAKTGNKAKEVRLHWGVNSVAAVIERGQVFLRSGASWSSKIVDEAAVFPHGKNDDLIDALVHGVTALMPKAWVADNLAKRAAANAQPSNFIELHNHQLREAIRKRTEEVRKQRAQRKDFTFPGY